MHRPLLRVEISYRDFTIQFVVWASRFAFEGNFNVKEEKNRQSLVRKLNLAFYKSVTYRKKISIWR